MNREMFKSATLVSLFILCIVLTGQLMLSLSTERQDSAAQALSINKTFDIKEVFSPQSFIVSFGGGIYTQNYSEENSKLWKSMQVELMTYLQIPENLSNLESIDEARWVELIKSRAIRFRLPFNMSLTDMQTMLNIEPSVKEDEAKFNSILVATTDQEGIYFANDKNGLYYRLKGPKWSDEIASTMNTIETNTEIEYRRVEDLFGLQDTLQEGLKKQNNSIFPITSMRVDFVNIVPEVDVKASDDSGLKSYANKAFGKQFNFVKKMRDVDQSVIYLYGYANKALRLGADGAIVFTQRLSPGTKLDPISLDEAIQIALGYIDQYGGAPSSLYLADYKVSKDSDGNQVYTLDFDYRIQDLTIINEGINSGHSISVELVGNHMSNFKRLVSRFKDSFMLDIYPRALTINEVLERNSNIIQTNYEARLPEGVKVSDKDIWTRILGDISHVELAYFLESDKQYLYPVWKLDIGDVSYAFRLYDGRLLKSQVN